MSKLIFRQCGANKKLKMEKGLSHFFNPSLTSKLCNIGAGAEQPLLGSCATFRKMLLKIIQLHSRYYLKVVQLLSRGCSAPVQMLFTCKC